MSTKHEDDCLLKAGDDEPIFVLRSTDVLAPDIVDEWATRLGICARSLPIAAQDRAHAKIAEARDLADAMRVWQREHGAKVPDLSGAGDGNNGNGNDNGNGNGGERSASGASGKPFPEVSCFDVMREMSKRELDIVMGSLGSNLVRAQSTKRGTQLTIGMPGDIVGRVYNGNVVGALFLCDTKQYHEIERELLEARRAASAATSETSKDGGAHD